MNGSRVERIFGIANLISSRETRPRICALPFSLTVLPWRYTRHGRFNITGDAVEY